MVSVSYRMADDIGHAPCVFDNLENLAKVDNTNFREKGSELLTLSCCGKNVRRMASLGDYVLGIAGNLFGERANKLLWIGKVEDVLTKEDYFEKYPNRPDNYYTKENGIYVMKENPFHDATNQSSDLNPANTLLFNDFLYFGDNVVNVPKELIAKQWPTKIEGAEAEIFMNGLRKNYSCSGVYGVPMDLDKLGNREAFKEWF